MRRKFLIPVFCLMLCGVPFTPAAAEGGSADEVLVYQDKNEIKEARIEDTAVFGPPAPEAALPVPEAVGAASPQAFEKESGAYYTFYYADENAGINSEACLVVVPYQAILLADALDAQTPYTLESPALDVTEVPAAVVPIVVNRKVEQFIKYFQTRGRKYFTTWLGRSPDYMPMVTGILREYGLPDDLFYIAFIESGLNPNSRSRAKAVGMWQFIKGTAKKYGLRVDFWIDERRDPEKSTRAAAKYFRDLYGHFGSWYLAAASYNAGEGRVLKAMRKHRSDDFWEISSHRRPLKKETKEYVPKYLAAMMIAKDPASYGFGITQYVEYVNYEKVSVPEATDLRVIAESAGTTVEEIKRLNPELLHWFTPPNYPGYEIKLPRGTKEQFVENFAKIPPPQRIQFLQHKVRRGETISKIAKRYGTSVKPILYLNNISNLRSLRPGTTIIVPVRAGDYARKGKGKDIADAVNVRWEFHG